VIRFLGSGEVCSDYLGLMCRPGWEQPIVDRLVRWLDEVACAGKRGLYGGTTSWDDAACRWDLIDLEQLAVEDAYTWALIRGLADAGHLVHQRAADACWRLYLPDCWEDYLKSLSKNTRRQLRKLERFAESGRFRCWGVRMPEETHRYFDLLMELHQRRQHSLGNPGSFASARFTQFHRDIASRWVAERRAYLCFVDIDGVPVAAEYGFRVGKACFLYLAGMEPSYLEYSPGKLKHVVLLKEAIKSGIAVFDFLRGDETYKAQLGGQAVPMRKVRIAAKRFWPRLKHVVWVSCWNLKQHLKPRRLPPANQHGRHPVPKSDFPPLAEEP